MIARSKARKYSLPKFLSQTINQKRYEKWLARRASAHIKRDKKRGNKKATREDYKIAIHKAVKKCGGIDAYTGEKLNWNLISKYNNELSRIGRRRFKAKYALLPTVDHVGDGLGVANFLVCSWRTNDAKGDLSRRSFVKLCRQVVECHAG